MNTNQLTLARLRSEYDLVEKTEHWNQFARRRNDLFGFADFIAVRDNEVLLVQTTSKGNMSARIKKIRNECGEAFRMWTASPNRRVEVWGWFKRGRRWQVDVAEVKP